MNRNLFFKEMQRNAFSFLLWMVVITLLVSVTMSAYPTFRENQSEILGMMSLIPKGALQLKGVSNFNDLFSVLGFYAANNVIYMLVLGSIFAVVLGSNILLKEEYDKTAEYLLTRPLTRSEIFLSKIGVIVLYVFLLNLVAALTGFFSLEYFADGDFIIRSFLVLTLYTLLLNILFATIGIFLSTLVKRARPITAFSIGVVLFFYFVNTLSKIAESVAYIGYISPFRFAAMDAGHPEYRLNPWYFLYFAGITMLLTAVSYRIYIKKDIYT